MLEQPNLSTLPATGKTEREIQEWLIAYLIDFLEVEEEDIDPDASFDSYALDSTAAVSMTADLADWLGYELEPSLSWEYPSVRAMAGYLASV